MVAYQMSVHLKTDIFGLMEMETGNTTQYALIDLPKWSGIQNVANVLPSGFLSIESSHDHFLSTLEIDKSPKRPTNSPLNTSRPKMVIRLFLKIIFSVFMTRYWLSLICFSVLRCDPNVDLKLAKISKIYDLWLCTKFKVSFLLQQFERNFRC